MMKSIFVELRVSQEVEGIVDHYEHIQEGLGLAFQAELKAAFLSIRRSPEAFGHDAITGDKNM